MRDLMHAIYDRIAVAGPVIAGVQLTQAAYAHGLALALQATGPMRTTSYPASASLPAEPARGRLPWMNVDHDGGVLEGSAASSGRTSIVPTKASKNSLTMLHPSKKVKDGGRCRA